MYIGIELNYNLNPAFARLTIHIAPNLLLLVVFATVGLLACVTVFVVPIALGWQLSATGLIVLLTIHAIFEHALLKLPYSIVQLSYRHEQWLITDAKGQTHQVKIHGSSFVAAYCSVINVKIDGDKMMRTVLITPSRVDADAFRRLRVLFRWNVDLLKADVMP